MITPVSKAVFIGLGSTGVNILYELRKLVFEEYGIFKLPIFEYVGIETARVPYKPRDMNILELNIPSTAKIQEELTTQHLSPTLKAMRSWLDDNIFLRYTSFTDGAAGCRLGGRLLLWDQWAEVERALNDANRSLRDPTEITKAEDLLRAHYRRKQVEVAGDPVVDDNPPIVYVFGTFCGGTCGGMFFDIGFMLKRFFPKSHSYGIFTVMHPNVPQGEENPAANCYGAIKEANFFYHPHSNWDFLLPDGKTRADPIFACHPYNLLYLVSTSNPSCAMDKMQLAQMIAMMLFFDVICAQERERAAALQDLEPLPDYRKVREGGWCCRFHTFGLSALWYPKYRISGVAACDLGLELCEHAAGRRQLAERDQVNIVQLAEEDWRKLWGFVQKKILRPGREDAEVDVLKRIRDVINQKVKDNNLIRTHRLRMNTILENEDFKAQLKSIVNYIDEGMANLRQEIVGRIRSMCKTYLGHRLDIVKLSDYLEVLRKHCEQETSRSTDIDRQDTIAVSTLDGIRRREARVRRNKLIASVFLRIPAIEDFREDYVNVYIDEWMGIYRCALEF